MFHSLNRVAPRKTGISTFMPWLSKYHKALIHAEFHGDDHFGAQKNHRAKKKKKKLLVTSKRIKPASVFIPTTT